MPSGQANMQSWARQMENEEEEFDHNVEYIGDTKVVTMIRFQDNKQYQVKQYFKTEKRKVSAKVAERKTWAKYGLSEKDIPGPNPKTTIISEEIQMEFLTSKEEESLENSQMNKGLTNQNLQCRNCGHNHWTIKCPFTNQLNALNKLSDTTEQAKADDRTRGRAGLSLLRDSKRMDLSVRSKDENNTIRITNLPEETQDGDIRDLFKDFGRIIRIFLAKDKATGNSKGFAFVSFDTKENAKRAIKAVNGHGYNNLILNVEWAKPSGN